MAGYVDYDLTVDVDAIVAAAVAQLQAALGVTLNEGDPAVALLEAIALRNAETRLITVDVAAAAFADFGRKIVGVEQIAAAPATVASTWTAVDNAGYTIPAGTRVSYATTGDQRIGFEVVTETVIAPGATQATGVELAALVAGEDANGLVAGTVQLVDPLAWVSSVVTTATTAGGVDAELDADYLDRLTETLQLLTRVPIRPDDYAVAARSVAGVHRALVVNLYDADTSTPDVPGHVTVVPVDEDGVALDAPTKAELEALLTDDGMRMLNVEVHVEDPTPVAITVDFDGVARDGYDPDVLEAAGIAVLNAALDPGAWAGGDEDPPEWRAEHTVYVNDLIGLLYDQVEGLHQVTLTINAGSANVDLSSAGTVLAPLPDATVTGTVV
jgi:hypothetical protein